MKWEFERREREREWVCSWESECECERARANIVRESVCECERARETFPLQKHFSFSVWGNEILDSDLILQKRIFSLVIPRFGIGWKTTTINSKFFPLSRKAFCCIRTWATFPCQHLRGVLWASLAPLHRLCMLWRPESSSRWPNWHLLITRRALLQRDSLYSGQVTSPSGSDPTLLHLYKF